MKIIGDLDNKLCFMVRFYNINGEITDKISFSADEVEEDYIKAYSKAKDYFNIKKDIPATIIKGYFIDIEKEVMEYSRRWEIGNNKEGNTQVISEVKYHF